MSNKKEYYRILEIPVDASDEDIKKSFREKAKQLHPDTCTEEDKKKELEEKFKKLNEAYDTLSTPDKKAIYDAGGNPNDRRQQHQNPFPHDIESILSQIFGGRMNGGHFSQQQTISVEKEISYYEMICGGEIEIENTPVGKVKVNLPQSGFPGAQFRVKIKQQGNIEIFLQIHIKLKMPSSLTQEQKDKIKELGI